MRGLDRDVVRSQGASRTGFTIVELVTVIALVGILAAVSGPRFFDLDGFTGEFFFSDTLAAVRYAQKLAIATGCNTQVTIAANSYTVNLQDGPPDVNGCAGAGYAQVVVHPGTRESGYSGTAPSGVVLASPDSPFLFDSLGRSMDAATQTVSDATITVGARTISVVGETGLVYEP